MGPMQSSNRNPAVKVVALLLSVGGLAMIGIGLYKAVVVGFYDSDLPWLGTLLLAGSVCTWVGAKLFEWVDPN